MLQLEATQRCLDEERMRPAPAPRVEYIERIVEVPYAVERAVEVEKVVEVPVVVEKVVEVPVVVEKIVERIVEKIVEVPAPPLPLPLPLPHISRASVTVPQEHPMHAQEELDTAHALLTAQHRAVRGSQSGSPHRMLHSGVREAPLVQEIEGAGSDCHRHLSPQRKLPVVPLPMERERGEVRAAGAAGGGSVREGGGVGGGGAAWVAPLSPVSEPNLPLLLKQIEQRALELQQASSMLTEGRPSSELVGVTDSLTRYGGRGGVVFWNLRKKKCFMYRTLEGYHPVMS